MQIFYARLIMLLMQRHTTCFFFSLSLLFQIQKKKKRRKKVSVVPSTLSQWLTWLKTPTNQLNVVPQAETRERLQQKKDLMMRQIAQTTQECASQFQSQLDNIDQLMNTEERKIKGYRARQNRQ